MAKREQIISPKGIFKFAHLNSPDFKGAERFGGEPQYKVTLVLDRDGKGVPEFLAKLDKLLEKAEEAGKEQMDEANGKAKAAWKKKGITEPTTNDAYTDEVDEEGNPTGRVEVKFKTAYKFKTKEGKVIKKTVPFIDGRGEEIAAKKRPQVYGGTEGRIAFTYSNVFIPKDADVYLGLYLNSIQITKLSSGGSNNPFGADEDSDFSADDLDENEGDGGFPNDEDDDDGDLDDDGGDESEGDGDESDGDLDDEIPF